MKKLLWLPEHPAPDAATPCLSRHGAQWVSAPMPTRGEEFVAVVPAACVRWHRVTLPRAARGKWREAAAALLEPALMQDAEDAVFHVDRPAPDGARHVAVLDAAWVAAAQRWLEAQQLHARAWVAETALLDCAPGRLLLFGRAGEWLLTDGTRHVMLDLTADDTAPELFRTALNEAAFEECLVAGLPEAGALAERHTPAAPLWLATLGVRARTLTGTQWLREPVAPLDLSGRRPRTPVWPTWRHWRLPLALGLAALATHLGGLALQTLQWRSDAAALKTDIAQREAALAKLAAPLEEHRANRTLATQLERLSALEIPPQAMRRLNFEAGALEVELDARGLDLVGLQTRLAAAGGALAYNAQGAPLLRFANPTGAR